MKSPECRAGRGVPEGELLIEIDPMDYQLEVRRLSKELAQAKATLQELEVDLENTKASIELAQEEIELQAREVERLRKLVGRRIVAESELDQALSLELAAENQLLTLNNRLRSFQTSRDRLKLAIELGATRLEQAEIDLERTKVTAPIDGVIVQDPVEADGFVQAGATLFVIEDTSAVEILCNLRMDQLFWLLQGRDRLAAARDDVASEGSATPSSSVRSYDIPQAPATVIYEMAGERFRSISLDLIFGCPGETMEDWKSDLQAALRLEPDHLSTYGLTYEKGTRFWNRLYHGQLVPLDEQLEREMFETAIDTLKSAGYEHYEVSNFARPGHRCRHNETYWSGEEYYAAGAGAASYLDGRRESNHRSVTAYIKRVLNGESPVVYSERLKSRQAAQERLVFGLRRLQGVDCHEFQQQTGFSVEQLVGPALQKHLDLSLLETAENRLRLTREGLMVSDSIWPDFLNYD